MLKYTFKYYPKINRFNNTSEYFCSWRFENIQKQIWVPNQGKKINKWV